MKIDNIDGLEYKPYKLLVTKPYDFKTIHRYICHSYGENIVGFRLKPDFYRMLTHKNNPILDEIRLKNEKSSKLVGFVYYDIVDKQIKFKQTDSKYMCEFVKQSPVTELLYNQMIDGLKLFFVNHDQILKSSDYYKTKDLRNPDNIELDVSDNSLSFFERGVPFSDIKFINLEEFDWDMVTKHRNIDRGFVDEYVTLSMNGAGEWRVHDSINLHYNEYYWLGGWCNDHVTDFGFDINLVDKPIALTKDDFQASKNIKT